MKNQLSEWGTIMLIQYSQKLMTQLKISSQILTAAPKIKTSSIL